MYDFHELAPAEFEELVRDLLQEELGIRLESFGPGRDKGIDCRFSSGETNIVVQAKHYLRSGRSGLLRELRAEAPKIGRLKPTRYIIATSVSMTPGLKEAIISLFPGVPLALSDVFGQEDLNNLLRRHAKVEDQHTKLWLKSSAILRRIIVEDVPSPSLPLAADAGESHAAWFLPPCVVPVGREEIIRNVMGFACRDQRGSLLLVGSPAIGKTTIALSVANSPAVAAHFGSRRCFVQLDREGGNDAAMLKRAIARAVGFHATGVGWQSVLAELARARSLIILDNLETPWEADPTGTEAILLDLSKVQNLVLCCTLRGAERPARVRWDEVLEVPRLDPAAAAELFLRISGHAARENSHLQALLDAMDGVPLAIELLAEQAQYTPAQHLWQEWQDRKTALLRRAGREPNHLNSLAVSIALSVASPRTTAPGRKLFAILGRLPAGCTSDCIAAIMGKDAFAAASGLRRTRLAYDRAGRLVLLSPVREYAAKRRLARSDQRAVSRYFVSLLEAHSPASGVANSRTGIDLLLQEEGNLDAALRLALKCGIVAEFTRDLLWRLSDFQRFSGASTPDILLEISHSAGQAGEPVIAAQAMLRAGEVYLHRSRYDQALQAFADAKESFRDTSQGVAEATCIKCTGDVFSDLGRMDEACGAYRAALRAYRCSGSDLGEANCWYRLTALAIDQGKLAIASRTLAKAKSIYERLSDILGCAHASFCAGEILLQQGQYSAAREAYSYADDLYGKQGYLEGEGRVALAMATLAAYNQDAADQREQLYRALKVFERLHNPYWLGEVHFRLSQVSANDEHSAHRAAAGDAWHSIDREDLIKKI